MEYREVKSCRICGSKKLRKYLDLGKVSPCNQLLDFQEQKKNKFPIQVLFCEECYLSQLSVVVKPELLYSDYPYRSSVSNTFRHHCNDMAKHLKDNFKFKNPKPTCMDIAANDGCLLREFRKHGFIVRGFEPCKELAMMSQEDLILVRPEFFSEKSSRVARSWSGEDVITATNVFAHVDDLRDFLRGVKYQQESNLKGIFVVEVPYLPNLIKQNQFDTIYHEHLSYFLLNPLFILFQSEGIPIFKVEQYPIHGGSIRIYASMANRDIDKSVLELLAYESSNGFYKYSTYENFSKSCMNIKRQLATILELFYHTNNKVVGYGASAKGISLLNYCDIPSKYIKAIVDDTPQKQGKFIPGLKTPIVNFDYFEKEKPEVIMLLSWNFKEELIDKTNHLNARYIVPIPKVSIL